MTHNDSFITNMMSTGAPNEAERDRVSIESGQQRRDQNQRGLC